MKKRGEPTAYNGHKKRNGIKIHACVTCDGFSLAIIILPGNEHDSKRFIEVMDSIKLKSSRRPRTRPLEVLADSAYDNKDIREYLRSRSIKNNIPVNPRNLKKIPRGRPTRFEYESYHKRGAIEKLFGWLKKDLEK
ncbi:transposase [Methanosalsum zhilinae]|uniref:transposase n=1 Tax=Methanosalsum zhilinae TaxID=39669 RepID=UPI00315D614D